VASIGEIVDIRMRPAVMVCMSCMAIDVETKGYDNQRYR
jgi:hypothetical protein